MTGGIAEVGDGFLQVADECSLIGAGQETRGPKLSALEDRFGTDDDEAGQVLILSSQSISEPGAHAWPREGLLAGAHLQCGPRVVDVVGHHRTNDADVVNTGSRAGQEFAHFNTRLTVSGKFPRRREQVPGLGAFEFGFLKGERLAVVLNQARLGVEEVHMRRAARHVEKNDALGARRMMRRSNGVGSLGAIGFPGTGKKRFGGQQIGQREKAEGAARTDQPFAARKISTRVSPHK